MPRLRYRATGSVINVSDAEATSLGDGYEPVEEKAEEPSQEGKKSTSRRKTDDNK